MEFNVPQHTGCQQSDSIGNTGNHTFTCTHMNAQTVILSDFHYHILIRIYAQKAHAHKCPPSLHSSLHVQRHVNIHLLKFTL